MNVQGQRTVLRTQSNHFISRSGVDYGTESGTMNEKQAVSQNPTPFAQVREWVQALGALSVALKAC